jgi:ERCC4-type nuclease
VITIDDRVGSAELLPLFAPGRATIQRLSSADFSFVGVLDGVAATVGIERKTVSEVVRDFDRFVVNQLTLLQNEYNYAYVIVEGYARIHPTTGLVEIRSGHSWESVNVRWGTFVGRLHTLRRIHGVTILSSLDTRTTAATVQALEDWFQRPEHKSTQCFYRDPTPVSPVIPSVYRKMLACVRGLGWETTLTVVKAYPSLERLVAASVDDLTQLPKIGRKTAEAIYASLHTEFRK